MTAAQVRAPVRVQVVRARRYCQSIKQQTIVACDHRIPPGFYEIGRLKPGVTLLNIKTIARVPSTSVRSSYELDVSYSKSPTCFSDGGGVPDQNDVRAGQHLLLTTLLPSNCPGPVSGAVRLVPLTGTGDIGPPVPNPHPLVVGRFTVDPTAHQR